MSRKNSKEKIKLKPFKVVKEVGSTEFSRPIEQTGGSPIFSTVGNYRSIENFVGIRLNKSSHGFTSASDYYLIYENDIQKCFSDSLSVAYVYFLPNRNDTEGIKEGTCRQSISGKALKVLLDSGRQLVLNKSGIEKCLENIYYIGSVLEIKETENHDKNANKTGQ